MKGNAPTDRAVDGKHSPGSGDRRTGIRLQHDRRRAANHRTRQGREAEGPGRRIDQDCRRGQRPVGFATDLAKERGGYFVHPHLDPRWTDGYQSIAAEVVRDLPGCRSLVFPVGGGGLLMGLLAYLRNNPAPLRMFGCEPYNYPKYARFDHARSTTIADGLILETAHSQVQQAIANGGVAISLVAEADIRTALKDLFETQAVVVEPSSAITLAFVKARAEQLEEPICVILTGENIAREDHRRLISAERDA